MHYRHKALPGNPESASSSLNGTVERLMEIWRHHDNPSLETLKHVTELADKLPEPHKAMALAVIGNHFANNLSIQYLELMATLWDRLEQNEINQEDLDGTLEDILPDQFQKMMKLGGHLNIHSLTDLQKVCAAINYACTLSHETDTETAWSLLYTLPRISYETLSSSDLLYSSAESNNEKEMDMQNKQERFWHAEQKGPDALSRTQSLIQYLHDVSQRDYKPSADTLKDIVAFVLDLPDPYKIIGLRAIAAHFVNSMSLHYLQIMATFQEKAEREDIDQAEQASTLDDVMPQWFQQMMELDHVVIAQSIDDLVKLANITIGLFRPSQLASAESAQHWIYSLPEMYYEPLMKEGMILNKKSKDDEKKNK